MCHIVSENQNNPAVELTAEEEQQKRSEILQIRRDKLSALQEEGKRSEEHTSELQSP